mmetsp:Transcript_76962/g.249326  ORF Transcript_76962/g.249326 Transcript_76962/m.249326 type:complete len:261 (+) Transcript_76962:37-819(+)
MLPSPSLQPAASKSNPSYLVQSTTPGGPSEHPNLGINVDMMSMPSYMCCPRRHIEPRAILPARLSRRQGSLNDARSATVVASADCSARDTGAEVDRRARSYCRLRVQDREIAEIDADPRSQHPEVERAHKGHHDRTRLTRSSRWAWASAALTSDPNGPNPTRTLSATNLRCLRASSGTPRTCRPRMPRIAGCSRPTTAPTSPSKRPAPISVPLSDSSPPKTIARRRARSSPSMAPSRPCMPLRRRMTASSPTCRAHSARR